MLKAFWLLHLVSLLASETLPIAFIPSLVFCLLIEIFDVALVLKSSYFLLHYDHLKHG